MKRPTPVRQGVHVALRAYQLTLSGLTGRQCRYLPTCSEYADVAILRHGVWAGGWMGVARICRCHPWGGAGYDPAPEAVPSASVWYAPWRYGMWSTRDAHDRARSAADRA